MINECLVKTHFRALEIVYFTHATKNSYSHKHSCANIEWSDVHLKFLFRIFLHFKLRF